MNERWCEMAGLSSQATIGQGWLRALHPEDRDRVTSAWRRAVQAKLPFSAEHRLVRPDGFVTCVYGQAVAEKTTDGTITISLQVAVFTSAVGGIEIKARNFLGERN